MHSPIRHLMKGSLAGSVFAIAPERIAQFDSSIGEFSIVYTNDRKWKFCADPKTREIFISRGSIELIWCASLAHFLFYTRVIQGLSISNPKVIDPNTDAPTGRALSLLLWALNCQWNGDTLDDWPVGYPFPLESPEKESDENVADELCLVTCAFLLHHELAHIRLGHSAGVGSELSLAQEKEADIAAADWILDNLETTSPMFVKRILGIVQAGLLTTALCMYKNSFGGNTHPLPHDRLSSLMSRPLGNERHIAKGFAFAILSLHLQQSGRKLSKNEFEGHEEAFEAVCDQLAAEAHGLKSAVG